MLAAHRDRDFLTICSVLLDEIRQLGLHAIRIVEVNEESSSTIDRNLTSHSVTDEANPLNFIAHRGHMRWLQPSVITGINLRKEWRANVDCVRDIVVLGWSQLVITLDPCNLIDTPWRRCGQIVKSLYALMIYAEGRRLFERVATLVIRHH